MNLYRDRKASWFQILSLMSMILASGCSERPTYEEASAELAELARPTIHAIFADLDARPEELVGGDNCSDALVGPSDGLRPTVEYRIPITALPGDPKSFALKAEKVWTNAGLKVESDETAELFKRSTTKGDYALHAFVNFASEEATLSGTGPCVDNPNPD